MNLEQFEDLYAQLIALTPDIQGVALIANEGTVLFQTGETVADETIIGVAGAAVMRLAEHISAGLAECNTQEITIRCHRHAAFFAAAGADTLLMLVLPADTDTRPLAGMLASLSNALFYNK
ncbi:roadblock/LC7 domain-containing protein [Acidithiobacillus thiooxidans]|uniref:roadblock/LC7 domain-containing protein n=1 Tax=Acidithiobacillus thiooxidans TaxID=930 RepID=UPI00285EFD5C|nr:roadblock/LC7 domain-containing protein [Acidithiobacillus thiooxidans]MDR7926860.1 roadblock/LC7 domain-containing protein [Acidithiobacillus thiooxidans]